MSSWLNASVVSLFLFASSVHGDTDFSPVPESDPDHGEALRDLDELLNPDSDLPYSPFIPEGQYENCPVLTPSVPFIPS